MNEETLKRLCEKYNEKMEDLTPLRAQELMQSELAEKELPNWFARQRMAWETLYPSMKSKKVLASRMIPR